MFGKNQYIHMRLFCKVISANQDLGQGLGLKEEEAPAIRDVIKRASRYFRGLGLTLVVANSKSVLGKNLEMAEKCGWLHVGTTRNGLYVLRDKSFRAKIRRWLNKGQDMKESGPWSTSWKWEND